MPFRTKIFLGWVALTLCLGGGTFYAIRRSVQQSFNRAADETFVGINRGLHNLYVERVENMRRACQLVANVPELRALIAEGNAELTPENEDSLQERLDYFNSVVGATFVCALNDRGAVVAQNKGSPWSSLHELDDFLRHSPSARALSQRALQPDETGQSGLWVYRGRLFQVAAVPLVFQNDAGSQKARAEGALLMGNQITDEISQELGTSYGCEITFLSDGRVAGSSLPRDLQQELTTPLGDGRAAHSAELELGGASYRATFEPLEDPCSGLRIGTVVIQQNKAREKAFLWQASRSLVLIILVGIVVAAFASFLLSLAVTRPVHALVDGVHRIAQGELDVAFRVRGRDELAQLGVAFNDMVGRLRESRDELQRLLTEARKAAQRERLLHEVAQHINQRLDVQSSLTMFRSSVLDLFPDVALDVFHFEEKQWRLLAPDHDSTHEGGAPSVDDAADSREVGRDPSANDSKARQAAVAVFDIPGTHDRLMRHELVYVSQLDGARLATADPDAVRAGAAWSTCLVPMRTQQDLLGVISATRMRPDAFAKDERDFLQALADHFAIALANAQVYEELRQAYRDLRANQQQIIQTERLRALGQMASGIAHDFNNHLTGVLAFLEMSLDREDVADELRTWLEMSRESALAAAKVVELLRNFYRRDTNEEREPVDLDKLVTSTISLTRPRWFDMPRRHGAVINVNADLAEAGSVSANASELRDALTNLIFNAIDAMPQGGNITIRTRCTATEVILEVADTGTGMSDEVRQQCLDPFFTTKGAQGTGLGLSMVHGIVERHRGRLLIDSHAGGTTIRLVLPRAEGTIPQPSQLTVAAHDGPRRILCVDDDLRVLKSLEGLLRQLGHAVTTTDSGADAIARIQSESFDVLITDLGMPGMDGREVVRNAKQVSPGTRVLMLTGWADRLNVECDLPEGVDRLLGKPITKAQLQQALA